MTAICDKLYSNKKRSIWEGFSNSLAVAKEIAKLSSIDAEKAKCEQGAVIYYMSVRYFGQANYVTSSPKLCHKSCVVSKGSPDKKLYE